MKVSVVIIALLLFLSLNGYTQEILSDPYEILNKYYEAIGGLEKQKAIVSTYIEGRLTLEGTGLEGTLKQWYKEPLKERQELDLTIMKQLSGDNGEFSWGVDPNGKIQIMRDENTLKAREIKQLKSNFEDLNPESEYFTVTLEGIEKIGDIECYKIKTTNSIDGNDTFAFYNTSNFLLEKAIQFEDNMEVHSIVSDYRDLEYGIKVAFKTEQTILPIGQKTMIQFEKYEVNPQLDNDLFEPPSDDVVDFKFENGKSSENIPFEFIENHIYLKVILNGTESVWILDSGASASVIDKGFAAELGLNLEGNVKGQGVGSTIDVSFTELPPFSLGSLSFNEQQITAIDIKWLFDKVSDKEVVGILGYDFLSRLTTKIDYAKEVISFYHPDKFKYIGEGEIINAPLAGTMPTIPLTIDGEYSGTWRLDLGATGLSFHYPFAEENNLLDLPYTEGIAFGAGGEHLSRSSKFQTAEISDFTIQEPIIDIPFEKGEGAFASKDYIGNVGNAFLRHFVLYLDYKNQTIILEKGDNYEKEFPRGKCGLQLIYSDDREIEVLHAAKGSPAEKAGFKRGDLILAVNGIDVEFFAGIVEIRKLFKQDVGTKYTFDVLRDGKKKRLKLKLKELL